MKRLLFIAMLWILCGCEQQEPMSVRMVRSEMRRNPQASQLDGMAGELKWNYTTGLELKAFLDVYKVYGGEDVLEYVDGWYDAVIDSCGRIGGKYAHSKQSLDHVCPAFTLFDLNQLKPKAKYVAAIDSIRAHINTQPRIECGGFWHKGAYPYQMWLDGLYMAEPFYARYAVENEDGQARADSFDDVAFQFRAAYEGCFDKETGLLRHAFDDSRQMFWCDPETGQSAHCWGRALGWYTMALVEVLEIMPSDVPCRADIEAILKYILDKIPDYADPESGMWYQVLDSPEREGNYIEASCSIMFTYAYLKASRLGLVPSKYSQYGRELYEKFLKAFVTENEDGTLTINQCCAVAGLGGSDNRSGDYEYYIHERIAENDCKAVGPFIWASLEYEKK